MIYGLRSNALPHGTVLTKLPVVEAMLDLLNYKADLNLSEISIIDPCGGEGAFICTCIERLAASSDLHQFSFDEAYKRLKVIEIDTRLAGILRSNIFQTLSQLGKLAEIKDWENILVVGDFLQYQGPHVDIVVGNPPYVRHDNLPGELKALYKHLFSTFRNRCDLYVAFYEKGLRLLKPGGLLSFICANRWLKNQYGETLRQFIAYGHIIEWNLNLEAVKPFHEGVDAYASITQIRKGTGLAHPEFRIQSLSALYAIAKNNTLPSASPALPASPVFPLKLIKAQGFEIGIGVATGADKILISKMFSEALEPECLLPLVLGRDVKEQELNWSGHYLINPWDENGDLRDLANFPQTQSYLISHQEKLSKRYVARKRPEHWFRLIDKIKPRLLSTPKILLADISRNRWVTIDEGHFYPHHNLYWITAPDLRLLKLLACFLMSDFVREQLHQFSPLMNGGYARWQSQHLRKLKVPVLAKIPHKIQKKLVNAYDAREIEQLKALTTVVLETELQMPTDTSSSTEFSDLPLFAWKAH